MWKYNFGGRIPFAQAEPTHTYRKPGTYMVSLKAWAFGPDRRLVTGTTQHVGYITVS